MWQRTLNTIRKFLKEDDGPTAVEYAVILMLIFMVCIATIQIIGLRLNDSFTDSNGELDTAFN